MKTLRSLLDLLISPDRRRSFALNDLDKKTAQHVAYDRGALSRVLGFSGGFFLEAGANDGTQQTNTLYLEKYLGWRGLLVEPVPELAEACRRNRPACTVESCALVPFDFSEKTVEIVACGLMSVVEGSMRTSEERENHVRLGAQIQQIQPYRVSVPARTLTDVLDRHGVREIDFFSLDVEGFELSVLRGLDLEKYRPRWLLIECRYGEEIETFLRGFYEPVAKLSSHDVLFRSLDRSR